MRRGEDKGKEREETTEGLGPEDFPVQYFDEPSFDESESETSVSFDQGTATTDPMGLMTPSRLENIDLSAIGEWEDLLQEEESEGGATPSPIEERRARLEAYRRRMGARRRHELVRSAPYAYGWFRTQRTRDLTAWRKGLDPDQLILDPERLPAKVSFWPGRSIYTRPLFGVEGEPRAILERAFYEHIDRIEERQTPESVLEALRFLGEVVGNRRALENRVIGAPGTPHYWLYRHMLYDNPDEALQRRVYNVDLRITPAMRMEDVWSLDSPEARALAAKARVPRDRWPRAASVRVDAGDRREEGLGRPFSVMSNIAPSAGVEAAWLYIRDDLRFLHLDQTFFEQGAVEALFPDPAVFPNLTHIFLENVAFEDAHGLNTLLEATYRMPNLRFLHIAIHPAFRDAFTEYDDDPTELGDRYSEFPTSRLPGYRPEWHPESVTLGFPEHLGARKGLHVGRLYPTPAYTDRLESLRLLVAAHRRYGHWAFRHLRALRLRGVRFASPPLNLVLSHVLGTAEGGLRAAGHEAERGELAIWRYLRRHGHPGVRAAPGAPFSPDYLVPPVARAELGVRGPSERSAAAAPRVEFLAGRRDALRRRFPDWDRREWVDLFPRLGELDLYASRPLPFTTEARADGYAAFVSLWIERAALRSLASWNTYDQVAREVATPLYHHTTQRDDVMTPLFNLPSWRYTHGALIIMGTTTDNDMTLFHPTEAGTGDAADYVSAERQEELAQLMQLWHTAAVMSHLRPRDPLARGPDRDTTRLVEHIAFAEEPVRREQERAVRPFLPPVRGRTAREVAASGLGFGRSLRDGRGFVLALPVIHNRMALSPARTLALFRTIDRPLLPSLHDEWPELHLAKQYLGSGAYGESVGAREGEGATTLRPVGHPLVVQNIGARGHLLNPRAFLPPRSAQGVFPAITLHAARSYYKTTPVRPPPTIAMDFTHLEQLELYRAAFSVSGAGPESVGDPLHVVRDVWLHLGRSVPNLRYLCIDGGPHAAQWERLLSDPDELGLAHATIHRERAGLAAPDEATAEWVSWEVWRELGDWPFQNLTALALRNLGLTAPPWGVVGVRRSRDGAAWRALAAEYPRLPLEYAHRWSPGTWGGAGSPEGPQLAELNIFPSLLFLDLRHNRLFEGEGAPGRPLDFLEAWMGRARRIGLAENSQSLLLLSDAWDFALSRLQHRLMLEGRISTKLERVPRTRGGRGVNKTLEGWMHLATLRATGLRTRSAKARVLDAIAAVRREVTDGAVTGPVAGGGKVAAIKKHIDTANDLLDEEGLLTLRDPMFHRLIDINLLERAVHTRAVFWANHAASDPGDGEPHLINFASLDLRHNGGPTLDRWPLADRQRLAHMRALMYFSHTNDPLAPNLPAVQNQFGEVVSRMDEYDANLALALTHNSFETVGAEEGAAGGAGLPDYIGHYALQSGNYTTNISFPLVNRGYGFHVDGDQGGQELTWLYALSGAEMLLQPLPFYEEWAAPEYGMGALDPATVYGRYPPPGWTPPAPGAAAERRHQERLEEARREGRRPRRVLPRPRPARRERPRRPIWGRRRAPGRFIAPRGLDRP